MIDSCLCESGKPFDKCCGRFLGTGVPAKTPEQLMRSRYTANALGGHGEYLLRTWFPATAQGLTAELLSERNRDWVKLEVLDRSQKGDEAMVEFKAHYLEDKAPKVMHEKSVFQRISGRWFYVGGEVS